MAETKKQPAAKRATTPKAQTGAAEAAEKVARVVEKTYSQDELDAIVSAAVQKAVADLTIPAQSAQDSTVTVLFIAEVSKESLLDIPGYGAMRPNSYLEVPKKEFGGKFMSPLVRLLIDNRHLLVVDGLNKDERIRWNCDYKEGEVLSEQVFDHMLDYDTARLCDIVKSLCEEHKRFVCRRIIQAKLQKDNRVSLEMVKAVNELTTGIADGGLLKTVIDDFRNEI